MKNKLLKMSLILFSTFTGLISCSSPNVNSSFNNEINSSKSEEEGYVVILMKYESLPLGSDDITLNAVVEPNSFSQEVIWSSSDQNVALVENGVLKVKGIGSSTITATSVVNSSWKDSFTLNVTGALIKGVIKDNVGNLLSGVNVSCGEKVTTSNNDGAYLLELEDITNVNELIFSKDGYRSRVVDISSLENGEMTQDIILIPSEGKINLSFTGSVKNILDGALSNTSVTIGETNINTNSQGLFTLENVDVEGTFNITVAKDNYVTYQNELVIEDYIEQIQGGNNLIDLGEIDLYSYQDEINIYTSSNKSVKGHIYRTLEGLKFTYDANFDITSSNFFYELFLDFGESSPSDMSRSDSRDMDFCIKHDGIISENKYNDTFGEGEKQFTYSLINDIHHIEVFFPYSYLKMESDEIFGFNVITHDDGVGDKSLNLFGNFVEWYNYYTYPRIGLDNKVYHANMNQNPFNLSDDEVVLSSELGVVGVDNNYQYNIQLARDETHLYIIADEVNDSHNYIHDGTKYHFFIDTEQTNFDRTTDNKVVHFELEAGRWLKRFDVNGPYSVFDGEKGMIDLLANNIKFFSQEGKTILGIPYQMLPNSFNRNSSLGIAANIEEGSGNWQKWQQPYISGYSAEPHVEEIKSFVRLSSELEVIKTA